VRILTALLVLLLAATARSAGAADGEATLEAPAPWDFAPFTARYRVRYDGLPFSGTAIRSLERDGAQLHFRSELRALFLRVDEQSTLERRADAPPRADFYVTRQKGLGRNRERRVDFDWEAGELVRTGDKPRVDPLEPGTLDPLGWQLLLRRDLARGTPEPGATLRYRITDGGDPEDVLLEVIGPASVEVPAGRFDAVLLERRYGEDAAEGESMRIWADPERDWILLRLEHVEDGRGLVVALEEILRD
jgi:hypothetical protein